MKKSKVRIFYLPLKKDIILGLVGVLILISFGLIHFENSGEKSEEVFNEQENKAYYQGPRDTAQIALAINVAWGEEYIPSMLETLDKHNLKATFFFIGRWVEKFPDMTKEIGDRGHEIANHGYRHLHPKQLSREGVVGMIKENEDLISGITGYKTDLFAPPYGEVDERIVEIAGQLGYRTIMWTLDTIDWQRPAPEVIINRVVKRVENGAIVLMHPTEPTAQGLPEIIERLKNEGYELVTISQLLE